MMAGASSLEKRMGHITMHRHHRVLALALTLIWALCAGACDDDMESPSTLDGAQILALQMSPRYLTPGAPHTLTALGHDLDDAALEWSLCLLPWIPTEAGVICAAETVAGIPDPFNTAISLGTGNPLSDEDIIERSGLPISTDACTSDDECVYGSCVDGACFYTLWLRAIDTRPEGALMATLQVTTGEATPHPSITALETEGAPLPESLAVNEELLITATADDPNGQGGQVISFFTSGGAFDPWRARVREDGKTAPTTFTAPEEAGEVTFTVIVRDPGGGVSWTDHTLTVTAAPESATEAP